MANALYGIGRQGFLDGSLDWDTQEIRILLVDNADYTVNIDVDNALDDVPGAGRVAESDALASKTVTLGVADAADKTWSAVSGDVSESIVGFFESGVESTSLLIFYIDTATGLPVTPNSGDITVAWDSGADKIFKL
jgi:hypothetical protein